MLLKIFLLLTFILIGRPQDFFSFLLPFRLVLSFTFLVLVGTILSDKRKHIATAINNRLLRKNLILYAIMIIGIPFSVHQGNSFDFVFFEYLVKILYLLFFVIIVSSKDELEKILFAVCSANLFYAGASIIYSNSFGGRFRFGTMYDPNDFAYFLISLFPLSFYFVGGKNTKFRRIFTASTIILSVILSIMTGSRGGLLGLVIVGMIVFFTKLIPFRKIHKIALLIALLLAVGYNITKINTERYSTILNPEEDYNVTDEQGRLNVWKRGWQLTLQNPITGVGVNCFDVAIGYYRQRLGVVPARWQAPHNTFIQVMTELGFPGIVVFIFLITGAIKFLGTYIKTNTKAEGSDPDLLLIARVLTLSFIGNIVTSFFLSMAYSPLLTLFIAITIVLQNLSEKESRTHILE